MSDNKNPQWLQFAREIEALGQIGLTYSSNEFEIERNKRLIGIAAEIVEKYSQLKKEPLIENFYKHVGYATPKVDVRAAIIKDGKILLVQERSDEKWCMPGGWADIGEGPALATEREVWEESGYNVKAQKLIGVFDANRLGRPLEFFHAYKLIFLCNIIDGAAKTSVETMGVDFFDFNDLPLLSQNRTNSKHLNEIINHIKDKNRPTMFE